MSHPTVLDPPATPPANPPADERSRPVRPPAARLALLALGGGIAFDIGVRGGIGNGVVAIGILFVVAALLADGRIEGAQVRWTAAFAAVPAAFLALRASPWLLASNLVAATALVGVAIVLARSGSVLDTTPARLLYRGMLAAERSVTGFVLLTPLAPRPSGRAMERAARVGLAVLIALPLLAVVVALLASADAVFAGLLVPEVDLGPILGHVALVGFFAVGVLCAAGATRGDPDDDHAPGGFGSLEIATMLGLAVAVLGLFVVSQLVALTDAGDRLVASSGLTPAEYARSGFFQLCWATAVLVGFLGLVRGLAAPGVLSGPAVRFLAAAVPLLALGLVGVSLRRMALYDRAFGLTMLRLWVVGAAVWMGALLIMLALRNLGVGGARNWVVGGAGAAALALVLLADLADAEGFVVRHNVSRAGDGAELDGSYLGELSDDAVPEIVDAIDEAPDDLVRRQLVLAVGCGADDRTGVAALNLAVARAEEARRELCDA